MYFVFVINNQNIYFSKKKCKKNILSNKPNVSNPEEKIKHSPIKVDVDIDIDADKSSNGTKISESEYDPTKKNYHPIRDAFWDNNQP